MPSIAVYSKHGRATSEDRNEILSEQKKLGVGYFKENWVWILTPMALIIGAIIWYVYFSGPTGGQIAPHHYPMFGN